MKLYAAARPDVKHGATQSREQGRDVRRYLSGHGFTMSEPESQQRLLSEGGKIKYRELPLDKENVKNSQNMIYPR